MRKYEKPTLEVVRLRVQENLAADDGNTTTYDMSDDTGMGAMSILGLDSL